MSATDFAKQDLAEPSGSPRQINLADLFARLRTSDNSALRALMVYGVRIGGAGLIFVAQVVLARWLSPEQYGIFANVWVVFVLVGGWSTLGIGGSMIRFVPEYRAHGRENLLRGLRRAGRYLGVATAAGIALVGFAGMWLAGKSFDAAYHGPIALMLLAMPFYAQSDINDGLCRAHGWPLRGIAPNYVMRPLLMIGGVLVAAFLLDVEPTASAAMFVVLAAFSLTVLVQTVITEVNLKKVIAPGKAEFAVKTWLAVAMPLVLMEGMLALMGHVDILLVGAMRGPEDVALYYAATRVVALIAFVPYAVIAVMGPRFSRYKALDDTKGLEKTARQAVTLSFWPSLVMASTILAAGPLLLGAFGAEFKAAYGVLAVLVVAVVIRAAMAPAQTMLAMTGNHGICVGILATALVLNAVLNLILISMLGMIGAAVATVLAILIELAISATVIKRRFGFLPVPHADIRSLRSGLMTIAGSKPGDDRNGEAAR